MMKKNLLMKLLKEHKPFRVFILDSDFGIFNYDPKNNKYQGVIGYMPLETIVKVINGYEEVNHIRIEEI